MKGEGIGCLPKWKEATKNRRTRGIHTLRYDTASTGTFHSVISASHAERSPPSGSKSEGIRVRAGARTHFPCKFGGTEGTSGSFGIIHLLPGPE